MDFQTVIIGAGPAGLSAAVQLTDCKSRVVILEKDDCYVGGISRTVNYKGFRFDIGGHRFFSKNKEVMQWWRDRLPRDFISVERQSRIFYRKKFFDYPLRPVNALSNLGWLTSAACVCSYLWRRVAPLRPERTFEEWVTNRFGGRLFDIFFRAYTEKVWGIPCGEISAEWASQRIKDLSLPTAIWNAMWKKSSGGAVIKTLVDKFEYPRLGPGMMWEKTRDDLVNAGAAVHMGRTVDEICHRDGTVTSVQTRKTDGAVENWAADHFIVSMPLQQTVMSFRPRMGRAVEEAALGLKYRDFITVALIVKGEKLFSDNWIYIHDPDVKVGRVQNFNNWSEAMVPQPGHTCLGLEYFCSVEDSIWRMADQDLIELGKRELEGIGLISAASVVDGCVVRTEKAYPVYDQHYQARVSVIRKELSKFRNLQVIGRNGMHKYNNQDHSMITGILAAKNLLGGNFDVWRVNTDAEYQESGGMPPAGRRPPSRIH